MGQQFRRYEEKHRELSRWMALSGLDFAYYLTKENYGNNCVCCGSTKWELGHITRPEIILTHDKKAKSGYSVHYKSVNGYGKMYDALNKLIHPLCRTCNLSSGGKDEYCLVHRKYIGIWNYLPNIDNLEEQLIIKKRGE